MVQTLSDFIHATSSTQADYLSEILSSLLQTACGVKKRCGKKKLLANRDELQKIYGRRNDVKF
jgi:hypothetical protein